MVFTAKTLLHQAEIARQRERMFGPGYISEADKAGIAAIRKFREELASSEGKPKSDPEPQEP